MKLKTLLSICAIGFGTFAHAQFGPGLFAGGSIGLTTEKSKLESGSVTVDGPKLTTLNFSPSIGYFFTENVAAGLRFGFAQASSKIDNGNTEDKISETAIGVELFGRYASSCGVDNFGFYTELNFGYGKITGKEESGSVTIDANPITAFNVGIQPGVMFFPSPKYGFEANLGNIFGFTTSTEEDADDEDIKSTTTNMNILDLSTMGLEVGFYYYFNR